MSSSNRVVNILVSRDSLGIDEARKMVRECRTQLEWHIDHGDLIGAEDCIQDMLGLEPDYLFDLIDPM